MREPKPYLVRCRLVEDAERCRRCRVRRELQARGFTVICVPHGALEEMGLGGLEASPKGLVDALGGWAAVISLAAAGAAALLWLLGWLREGGQRRPRRREEVRAWGGFLI
jgi:hypothetical protein